MEESKAFDWGGGLYFSFFIVGLTVACIQDLIFDEFITGRVTV
jgi:hypothetical protein